MWLPNRLNSFVHAPPAERGALVEREADDEAAGEDDPADEIQSEAEAESGAAAGAKDSGAKTAAGKTDDDGSEAEEEAAAEAAEAKDLAALLKERGLPDDIEALTNGWQAQQRLQQENEEFRNRMLWMLHNQEQQRVAEQARQQAYQQQQFQQQARVFQLPEYDPAWLQMVQHDDAGNLVAKSGADPTLPQKIQAYARAREDAVNRFLANPVGTLQQGIGPMVYQAAEQIASQKVAELQRELALRQYERDNADWVFVNQRDKSGGITPAAQIWNTHYREAVQRGLPDPIAFADAHLDALAFRQDLAHANQARAAQAAGKTAKDRDTELLKKAARTAGRSGAAQAAGGKKVPAKDPWAKLRAELKDLPEEDLASI